MSCVVFQKFIFYFLSLKSSFGNVCKTDFEQSDESLFYVTFHLEGPVNVKITLM